MWRHHVATTNTTSAAHSLNASAALRRSTFTLLHAETPFASPSMETGATAAQPAGKCSRYFKLKDAGGHFHSLSGDRGQSRGFPEDFGFSHTDATRKMMIAGDFSIGVTAGSRQLY